MYMKTELFSIVKIIVSQLTYICEEKKSNFSLGHPGLCVSRVFLCVRNSVNFGLWIVFIVK